MTDVIDQITAMLQPLLEGTDIFLISMRIKPINNLRVYIESDSGLSIAKSASINKKLYALIEESNIFPDGDFSLEVSSPGVGEPLMQWRQYKKNVGRTITVTPAEGADETGILTSVSDDALVLEQKDLKKKETKTIEIPFSQIKKSIVEITF